MTTGTISDRAERPVAPPGPPWPRGADDAIAVLVPALVASAAWLASAGLEYLGRQEFTGPTRHLLAVLAPETVRILDLTAPAPWGPLLTLLSAVAIAAAYGGLLTLVRRSGTADRLSGLAAYWFCAVAAAALVAVIPLVAEVAVAAADRSVPLGSNVEPLMRSAHWGLAWGWLPAALALLLDVRTTPSRRPRIPIAAASGALLVLTLAGSALAGPPAELARQAALPAAEPVAEPAPTGTPVPLVAPGEWQADRLGCTPGQLQFSVGGGDAAAGSRVLEITATNVSDAACRLEGYPDLAFSDSLGNALPVRIDHGGGMLSEDPGAAPVELAPAGAASAAIAWRAMPTAGLDPAGFLYVAASPGAERQIVPIETDITGGAVSVTAWGRR